MRRFLLPGVPPFPLPTKLSNKLFCLNSSIFFAFMQTVFFFVNKKYTEISSGFFHNRIDIST